MSININIKYFYLIILLYTVLINTTTINIHMLVINNYFNIRIIICTFEYIKSFDIVLFKILEILILKLESFYYRTIPPLIYSYIFKKN